MIDRTNEALEHLSEIRKSLIKIQEHLGACASSAVESSIEREICRCTNEAADLVDGIVADVLLNPPMDPEP